MKKRVLLLLPLFLGACSDSGESPVIKIEKLYAKVESDDENSGSGEKDYANQRDELSNTPIVTTRFSSEKLSPPNTTHEQKQQMAKQRKPSCNFCCNTFVRFRTFNILKP